LCRIYIITHLGYVIWKVADLLFFIVFIGHGEINEALGQAI